MNYLWLVPVPVPSCPVLVGSVPLGRGLAVVVTVYVPRNPLPLISYSNDGREAEREKERDLDKSPF